MSLDKINDLIAYVESPAYLRMVASAQGEDASALLGPAYAPAPADGSADRERDLLATPSVRTPRTPRTAARQLSARDGWWKFGECLDSRTPFKTYGKFRGTDRVNNLTGHLPDSYAHRYMDERPFIDYVVYSYATPIAWHVWNPGITGVTDADAYWVMPDTRYSVTTTRHQSKIRVALAQSGEDVRA